MANNIEVVRCNLRVLKRTHLTLFDHLSKIQEKGRAEECRYLMRLGLMFQNGGGNSTAPPVLTQNEDLREFSEKEESSTTNINSIEKSKEENIVELNDEALDLGMDLLDL